MHKLFVAVPITEPLKTQIEFWQKTQVTDAVRWVPSRDLHITLVPPWEAESHAAARDILKTFQSTDRMFDAHFNRIELGPDKHRPTVLWARGSTGEKLAALQAQLLGLFGQTMEHQFLCHITLGRLSRSHPLSPAVAAGLEHEISWRQLIRHVALMESHTTSYGTHYTHVETISI